MYPAFIIPARDEAEFAGRLSDEAKQAWFVMREIMEAAVAQRRPLMYLRGVAAEHAGQDGYSRSTLYRRYYDVVNGKDWRCLADMRKACGGGKSRWVTPEFEAWWHAEVARHGRGSGGWGGAVNAWRKLCRLYRAGETIGGVSWKMVWEERNGGRFDMPDECPPEFGLPQGWGYEQLCRRKAPKVFTIAAGRGKQTARALMPQVLTTRVGLEPGQIYAFDDLWHDFDVVWRDQVLRILELCCIDVASAYKAMALFRPRVRDEVTGRRTNLCEADMMLGVAHLLSTEGYHPDGCLLLCEGGTASLPDDYIRMLTAVSGGKITVDWSKSDRSSALAAHWRGPGKGNPRGKRWVESSHNPAHNALAHLPGQLGPDSRNAKPEWVEQRNRACQIMLDVANGMMTPEEAAALRFPLLRYDDALSLILEAYERIHASRDHRLEGWQRNRRLRWRMSPADVWHEMAELDDYDPADRAIIEAGIRSKRERYIEDTQFSRREVWTAGRPRLVRLAAHHVAALCLHLAKQRAVGPAAQMSFEDQELEAAPMVYRLADCLDPAGCRARLEEGREYKFLINPFDASRRLHVMALSGQYLGSAPRLNAAALADPAAIEAMVKSTGEAVGRQLQEIKRMGLPLTLDRLADERHNLAALRQVAESRRGIAAAASAEQSDARSRRRAAVQCMVAQ